MAIDELLRVLQTPRLWRRAKLFAPSVQVEVGSISPAVVHQQHLIPTMVSMKTLIVSAGSPLCSTVHERSVGSLAVAVPSGTHAQAATRPTGAMSRNKAARAGL